MKSWLKNNDSYYYLYQAIDRCHGINRGIAGQATEAVYLVGKETIEAKLIRIIQDKSKVIANIVDGEGAGERLNIFDLLSAELLKEDWA